MKELMQIALLIFFTGIVPPAFGQLAWTPEQKAVWKTGNLEQEITYHDGNYHYWGANSPAPVGIEGLEKKFRYLNTLGDKLEYYNAVTVIIWVEGNFVYVD